MPSESNRSFVAVLERTHGATLRRFLAARLRNAAADMPDLAQEVFLRLLRLDDHEAIRNPQAYLYTIASHVLHQHTLRQSAHLQTHDPIDPLLELSSFSDTNPELQVETEQEFEELGRALEQVSPRAYAVLLMHRCDGVPLKEIAERLGVSHSMTKRYLARALSYCKQRLQETR